MSLASDYSKLFKLEALDRVGCLVCHHTWLALRPLDSDFTRLSCPHCWGDHSEVMVDADYEYRFVGFREMH